MSDTGDLDRREQVARIDKLIAETHKLVAESAKFAAEARKYRWVDPLLAAATLIAAFGISRFLGH